jgi:hypothetical protein
VKAHCFDGLSLTSLGCLQALYLSIGKMCLN